MNRAKEFLTSGSTASKVVMIVVAGAVVFGIVYAVMTKIMKNKINARNNPVLIPGVHEAQKPLHFPQDLKEGHAVPIMRSKNEEGGIEFTYTYWFMIEDMHYKYGEWKHIFHKGNRTSWPNRAPGVWIHPETNSVRVYMNVYEKVLDFIDIENIPLNKWVHMGVVLKNKFMDVYVNGELVKRHELQDIPKQNFNDLYICNFGGFSGYLARFKYHNRAISPSDMRNLIRSKPSLKDLDSALREGPPYLSYRWEATQD